MIKIEVKKLSFSKQGTILFTFTEHPKRHARENAMEGHQYLDLLFKRHDFRGEALTPSGFGYRSRRHDEYALRSFVYAEGLEYLVGQMEFLSSAAADLPIQ